MTGPKNLGEHIPTLTEGEGGWRTYCLECSVQAGDYVSRCTVREDMGWWPPAVLVSRDRLLTELADEVDHGIIAGILPLEDQRIRNWLRSKRSGGEPERPAPGSVAHSVRHSDAFTCSGCERSGGEQEPDGNVIPDPHPPIKRYLRPSGGEQG